ncbi:MAG: hypothetical protein K9N51_08990 [Candidatus Pacebacteria bacterium]|nr:hypothetical protein [Candidatus Paceibacterota bacterium]
MRKPIRNLLGRLALLLAVTAGLVVLDWAVASALLWKQYNRIAGNLQQTRWPFDSPAIAISFSRGTTSPEKAPWAACTITHSEDDVRISLSLATSHNLYFKGGESAVVGNTSSGHFFKAEHAVYDESRKALKHVGASMRRLTFFNKLVLSVVAHPFITGWTQREEEFCWRMRFQGGSGLLLADGRLKAANIRLPAHKETWHIRVSRDSEVRHLDLDSFSESDSQTIPPVELDRSIATALRLAVLQTEPVPRPENGTWHEGKGRLSVRNGNRYLYLEGTPYEIGFQHGRLLAENAKRVIYRTLYGVGFYYSLERGQWFCSQARKLLERQRPYIDPDYLEEMKGLATGIDLPLELVAGGNLFPEFFHCSGAALFGKATADGEVLHARVLDYMTHIGLQDEAVVMAVRRNGVQPFVNVSYAGFIGSVTGMNQSQIAIGELGGGGEGKWDGTPMSFLVRGVLEHATTLQEAVAYMRDRPRTCEYFYVISNGRTRDAVGLSTTPEVFTVVHPGEKIDRLPEPVNDAVLMSAGKRYRKLVERVRKHYGNIDAAKLLEIIKRPIAMKSNLHNVVFEPGSLRMHLTQATRHGLACNQQPVTITWTDLFPERD